MHVCVCVHNSVCVCVYKCILTGTLKGKLSWVWCLLKHRQEDFEYKTYLRYERRLRPKGTNRHRKG